AQLRSRPLRRARGALEHPRRRRRRAREQPRTGHETLGERPARQSARASGVVTSFVAAELARRDVRARPVPGAFGSGRASRTEPRIASALGSTLRWRGVRFTGTSRISTVSGSEATCESSAASSGALVGDAAVIVLAAIWARAFFASS